MTLTAQHGLLGRLLDYIVEQSKEIDPRAFTLSGGSEFRRFPKDLSALPGVDLDLRIEGDHIWLRVQRLVAKPAPIIADESVRPFITITSDPMGSLPSINSAALDHAAATEILDSGEEIARQRDITRRRSVEAALALYLPLWQAWAEGEKPRRRSISLYGDLFMLKGRLDAEESSTPSELVWGMGVSAWKMAGPQSETGTDRRATIDYQYPVLTQAVEIDLDHQSHTLSVRPRAVAPRLEFDVFSACQLMRAATVERQAKVLLETENEHPLTPFDVASFEPILKLVAGELDQAGIYSPTHEGLPIPGERLLVTTGWVLFVRERSANYLVDDIRRLKDQVLAGVPIPPGPLCLVTPPSAEVVRYDDISFRGLCGSGSRGGQPRELYFPLPYNQEQEAIVEMLERAPGVCVQGPPGTGKTHTIANIICHFLATGRKVLVTSKGEHALEVLQEKIPVDVRPLSVALIAGDKEGMRQFQASIEAIIHNLSQLQPRATRDEIERCKQQIEAAHSEMAAIDRRVDEIASQQLSSIEVDGVGLRPQKLAEMVVSGRESYGWFDDELTLEPECAPPLTAAEAQSLRSARRTLGVDIVYAKASLPSSFSLPSAEAVGQLHNILVGIREIDLAESSGGLRALKAITPEVFEEARRLLVAIERVQLIVQQLEELNSPWVFELRSKCRSSGVSSERDALKALFGEIDQLSLARAAFMQQPVYVPVGGLDNQRVRQAVERAAETGRPFSALAFGGSEIKALVAGIKVSGLTPTSNEHWHHVNRYLELHTKVLSFSVRWNQFADILAVPPIQGGVESLRTTESVSLAARRAHELATRHEIALTTMAENVFRDPPREEIKGTSAQLGGIRDQLRRHLTRVDLSAAASQLAVLQEKLAGRSGPVSERLRDFVSEQLGCINEPVERVVARYAELVVELKRIEALAGSVDAVNELSRRFEAARAVGLANRLRTVIVASTSDDDTLPIDWRNAWNWSRISHYLDAIESRAELLQLSARRRDLEGVLATRYEQMVAKSAWLEAKERASARVLSALESYRVAIRRIGQGTGPNATRYRRDAQAAMLEAQGAIPCWIMSHSKVSESMPADLGVFDLVIVDEASQSNLWALPAVLRGTKVLVVGDDKQVSPSGGFISAARITMLRDRFLTDQPYRADLTPEKSLYDISSTVFAAQRVMLAEHFRCVQPIIAYSNRTFYKDMIRPLRVPRASERIDPPLVDVFVTDGIRDRADVNRNEAEFIVQEIEAIVRNPRMRNRTIGVVSLLGAEQAKFIKNLALARLDVAELDRRHFECGDAYVFQGSERDIMFLTMVADSRNHHALSGQAFEQRFNVAASRARDRMYLVRSVTLGELSASDIRRTLVEHFSRPFESSDVANDLLELCESGFERDVYSSLRELGYRVTPQVKAGAYRIDMVVEGVNDARLAIECDGDDFHGPDRWPADMQRQRILERAGWSFWRCFASTWSLRKVEVLNELRARLHAMGIEPLGALERTPNLVEFREWSLSEVAAQPLEPTRSNETQTTPGS